MTTVGSISDTFSSTSPSPDNGNTGGGTTSPPQGINLTLVIIIQSILIFLLLGIVIGLGIAYCLRRNSGNKNESSAGASLPFASAESNQIPPDQTYTNSLDHARPQYQTIPGNELPLTEISSATQSSQLVRPEMQQPEFGYRNDVFEDETEESETDNLSNETYVQNNTDILSPSYAYHSQEDQVESMPQGSTLPGYTERPIDVLVARSETSDEDYRKPKKKYSRHFSTFQPSRQQDKIAEEGIDPPGLDPAEIYFLQTRGKAGTPVLGVGALKELSKRRSMDFDNVAGSTPDHISRNKHIRTALSQTKAHPGEEIVDRQTHRHSPQVEVLDGKRPRRRKSADFEVPKGDPRKSPGIKSMQGVSTRRSPLLVTSLPPNNPTESVDYYYPGPHQERSQKLSSTPGNDFGAEPNYSRQNMSTAEEYRDAHIVKIGPLEIQTVARSVRPTSPKDIPNNYNIDEPTRPGYGMYI